MTNFEKITIVANQLANDGKKPTVALIKAKLSEPVPLPQIISTMKSWHHEPENCTFSALKVTENSKDEGSIEDQHIMLTQEQFDQSIKQAVDKAITPIKAELAEIKTLLENINKKSK